MAENQYQWTDNPTVSGVSPCNTDVLNDCLMHLKYDHSSGGGNNLFDTVLKDHILTYEESKGLALQGTYVYKEAVAGSREGYPDFYNKCLEEYSAATATEITLGENTIIMYVHANGHKFYNITDRASIDEFYNTNGSAWFYGIDTENERILLPRAKTSFLLGNDTVPVSVYGNNTPIAFITGKNGNDILYSLRSYSDGAEIHKESTSDMTSNLPINNGNSTDRPSQGQLMGLSTDPNLSGVVGTAYLTNDIDLYVYICVGNTKTTSAVTDVVEVTTSENDTIPLFTAQYFDFIPNNASWLKAGEQVNVSGIYTTAYNELVNCLNGVNKYNLKVINTSDMVSGIDYSEYWKVNQDEMCFVTPTKLSYGAYSDVAPVVGNGMTLGLMNDTQKLGLCQNESNNTRLAVDGVYGKPAGTSKSGSVSDWSKSLGVTDEEEFSGIEAHLKQSTAQLYFKVANAVQNLELLDAGEVLEAVSNMASTAVLKTENKSFIVETYNNGASGYNLYSNGYCEQWGRIKNGATVGSGKSWGADVTLLLPMVNTDYRILLTYGYGTDSSDPAGHEYRYSHMTNSSFKASLYNRNGSTTMPNTIEFNWEVSGYIA